MPSASLCSSSSYAAIEAAKSLSCAGSNCRLRGAQHQAARDLGERHTVLERGIDETPKMIERIVGGVIDAVISFTLEPKVQGIHPQMLQEWREVRT